MMLKGVSGQFFQKVNKSALALIILGTIAWSLTMVKSGLVYEYGVGFWGPNGHDGVWHVALAQGLAGGSWEMPIFAGESIRNYHIGFDLFLAMLHKLTFIPIPTLYFQILPPIFALLIGLLVYRFALAWRKSESAAFWTTFFVYFGGSWGWVVTLLRNQGLEGESMFWSQQSISTLINPPFALSLIFVFAGLLVLIKGTRISKSHSRYYFLLATFLFGVLVQIKIYAGILAIAGLFAAGVWNLFKKREISLIKVATGALIISILIFSPVSAGVGGTLIFKPFWFLEKMVSSPDRFFWPKMASAIANYELSGNWLKLIPAYGLLLIIFWFGNLGTRIIKGPLVFGWYKNWKKLTWLEIFFAVVTVGGAIIPLFFIQSGTPWNTIQFMYYSLIFSGILAGASFGQYQEGENVRVLHNNITKASVSFLIVVLTIPTTIGSLRHYLPSRPPAMISKAELEALNYLKSQPKGIVLTQPFDRDAAIAAEGKPPRPLYLYESTAYVSAFSGKRVYLEDEVNLDITGYEWRKRREIALDFLKKGEWNNVYPSINVDKIAYLYLVKGGVLSISDIKNFEKIFENDEVWIFRIN